MEDLIEATLGRIKHRHVSVNRAGLRSLDKAMQGEARTLQMTEVYQKLAGGTLELPTEV